MAKTDSIPTIVHDATSAAADLGRSAWGAAREIAADAATVVGSGTSHAAHAAADAASAGVDTVRRTAHNVTPHARRRRGSRPAMKAMWIGAVAIAALAFVAAMRRRRHAHSSEPGADAPAQTWAEREERHLAAS